MLSLGLLIGLLCHALTQSAMLLVLDWTCAGVSLIRTISGGTYMEVGLDSTINFLGLHQIPPLEVVPHPPLAPVSYPPLVKWQILIGR